MADPPEARIPPVPELENEVWLALLTHESVRTPRITTLTDADGDLVNIAGFPKMGEDILILFSHEICVHLHLSPEQMRIALSDDNVDTWLAVWDLRRWVIADVDAAGWTQIFGPNESRVLFYKLFGALVEFHGIHEVRQFFWQMVSPLLAEMKPDPGQASVDDLSNRVGKMRVD